MFWENPCVSHKMNSRNMKHIEISYKREIQKQEELGNGIANKNIGCIHTSQEITKLFQCAPTKAFMNSRCSQTREITNLI